jgi:hypothetical protein
MEHDRLLMVMPYHYLAHKASARGFRVYGLWDRRLESASYLAEVARSCEVLEFTDFDDEAMLRKRVREMADRYRVSHILHLGREETMLAVYETAAELGLSTNPPSAVRQLNDKAAMRDLLAGARLSPVLSREFASAAEVAAAWPDLSLPAVVKPTRMAGSRGVRLVSEAAELPEWRDQLAGYDYTGPVLVEEFLPGPEYSVETMTAEGRHHMIGITEKQLREPPGFVEIGHVHPAPVAGEQRKEIEQTVTALLDAAGYRFGPAHTEVIVTAAGVRVVESQARLAGDRIPRLIELATGFDAPAAIFQVLAGDPMPAIRPRSVAAISFFQLPAGRLVSLSGLDEMRALPFVDTVLLHHDVGELLPDTVDNRTRHGFVIVTAPTHAEIPARVLEARGLLRAEVDPVVAPPGQR